VRVVITDDEQDVRFLVRAALEFDDRTDVVGEASNGREAVSVVNATRPDVVLLDLRMPELSGEEAAKEIAEVAPDTAIVVFSAFITNKAELAQALGAAACLDKGTPIPDVVEALVAAGSGPRPSTGSGA
jgi:DNA-binding NarL/FixJ family response regulator